MKANLKQKKSIVCFFLNFFCGNFLNFCKLLIPKNGTEKTCVKISFQGLN